MVPKVAPCPLLYELYGGRIGSRWEILESPPEESENFKRLLCDKGFDCGQCELLHKKLEPLRNIHSSWWCSKCIREAPKPYFLPGFYQGAMDTRSLDTSAFPNFIHEEESQVLRGCLGCGEPSNFLQLIIWRTG
jgi:hypothetical protein